MYTAKNYLKFDKIESAFGIQTNEFRSHGNIPPPFPKMIHG